MKRKLLLSVMLCVFAGLTILNLGLAKSSGDTDTTLDLISVMAKAYDEGETTPECIPPLTDDQYFACYGCRATILDKTCVDKYGRTHNNAYKPDPA